MHQDIKLIMLLSIVFFFANCNKKQDDKRLTLNVSEQKLYRVNEEHTSILLLKAFFVDENCEEAKNSTYANAYLCSVVSTGDTIIVLNICEKPYDFLQNDKTLQMDNDLIIDSSKVYRQYPKTIITNLDSSTYNRHHPVIFADITKLLY